MKIKLIKPLNISIFTRTEKEDYSWQHDIISKKNHDTLCRLLTDTIYNNGVANIKSSVPKFFLLKTKNSIVLFLADMETKRQDAAERTIRTSLLSEFSLYDEKYILNTVAFLLDEKNTSKDIPYKLKPFIDLSEDIFLKEASTFRFPAHIVKSEYNSLSKKETFLKKSYIYSTANNRKKYANYLLSEDALTLKEFCFISTGLLSIDRGKKLLTEIRKNKIGNHFDKIIILSLSESFEKARQPLQISLKKITAIYEGIIKTIGSLSQKLVNNIKKNNLFKGVVILSFILAGVIGLQVNEIKVLKKEIKTKIHLINTKTNKLKEKNSLINKQDSKIKELKKEIKNLTSKQINKIEEKKQPTMKQQEFPF